MNTAETDAPFQMTPEIERVLENAIGAQLRASRDEFNVWFSELDTTKLVETSMVPNTQHLVRLLARRLCWEAWRAREPAMAIHNLRYAAARDLMKSYEDQMAINAQLIAQNKSLLEQNAKLRATIDDVLS